MKNYTQSLLILSALLMSHFAIADNHMQSLTSEGANGEIIETTTKSIQIPLKNRPTSNVSRPSKSMSQSDVIKDYGNPLKKHPTKGSPPITRWDYTEFSVYFESNRVIHSVVRSN